MEKLKRDREKEESEGKERTEILWESERSEKK